jgi:hypothetical protein
MKPRLILMSVGALLLVAYGAYTGPVRTFMVKRQLAKSEQRVVISLTTTPYRINRIRQVLSTLRNQSIKPDKIILNVPTHLKRANLGYKIPSWLATMPGISINRCEDYGPLTKLLPTLQLETNPKTIIITVDDDTWYTPHLVRDFLSFAFAHPNAVITPTNLALKFDNNFKIIAANQTYGDESKTALVVGALGAAYRRSFFGEDFIQYANNLPKECFLADDLVTSMYLAYKSIPIEQTTSGIFNPINRKIAYQTRYFTGEPDTLTNYDGGNPARYRACLKAVHNGKYRAYQEAFINRNNDINKAR